MFPMLHISIMVTFQWRRISSRRLYQSGEVCYKHCYLLDGELINYILDIDLTNMIPNLDKVASDLVTHQRDALVERKDLAQRTKDFRKLDDSAKLNEIKVLLKGRISPYEEEILN